MLNLLHVKLVVLIKLKNLLFKKSYVEWPQLYYILLTDSWSHLEVCIPKRRSYVEVKVYF